MSTSTYQAHRLVSRRSPFSFWNTLAAARHPRHARLLALIPTLALGVTVWSLFAPPQLGGATSYAITDGVSMLPTFHAGDLVLLRHEGEYNVGEVAAYENTRLGVTVMHRIVAVSGDHYVFKGDNNSWVDTYQPTAGQVVGAEWIHLAGWGNILAILRAPAAAAVALGLLWMIVFWPHARSRRQRRRRRHAR